MDYSVQKFYLQTKSSVGFYPENLFFGWFSIIETSIIKRYLNLIRCVPRIINRLIAFRNRKTKN
jgi:hypothetical protein